jgi:hypothetical protein
MDFVDFFSTLLEAFPLLVVVFAAVYLLRYKRPQAARSTEEPETQKPIPEPTPSTEAGPGSLGPCGVLRSGFPSSPRMPERFPEFIASAERRKFEEQLRQVIADCRESYLIGRRARAREGLGKTAVKTFDARNGPERLNDSPKEADIDFVDLKKVSRNTLEVVMEYMHWKNVSAPQNLNTDVKEFEIPREADVTEVLKVAAYLNI